jgi:hypothetical protein
MFEIFLIIPQKHMNFLKNSFPVYKSKFCALTHTIELTGSAREVPRQTFFACFFQASVVMGRPEKGFYVVVVWRRGKLRKTVGAAISVTLPRNNFTPARARSGPDFTSRGQRVGASQLLKKQSEIFLVSL